MTNDRPDPAAEHRDPVLQAAYDWAMAQITAEDIASYLEKEEMISADVMLAEVQRRHAEYLKQVKAP